MNPEDRPIQFRTVMVLYILLGVVVALTIHFILLSSPDYNWLTSIAG
jgi:light-harvesting complex 1 alpha chain